MAKQDLTDLRKSFTQQARQGAIVLDRRSLESRPALRLFDRLLGVEALILDEAKPRGRSSKSRLIVEGRLNALGIERCLTRVEINSLEGGDLSVEIELQPPEGWNLGQSFSSMDSSDLGDVPISKPTLRLRTHGDDGEALSVRDALSFKGDMAIGSLFGGLGPVLGSLVQAEMEGPIRIARHLRTAEIDTMETIEVARLSDPAARLECELSAPVSLDFSVPGFALSDFSLLVEGPHVVDWAPYPSIRRAVRARLDIAGQGIFIEGGATSSGLVSLRARAEGLSFSDIAQLATLMPGIDADDLLPGELGAIGKVEVTDIDAVLDVNDRSVAHLGLGLALETDWDIPGGIVSLDRIGAYLMTSGLGKKSRGIGATLSADLSVGDYSGRMTAYAAEYILRLDIPDLPLSALVTNLFPAAGPMLTQLPQFDLRNVALSVQPKTGALSARAESTTPWRISIGTSGIEIRDVVVELNRKSVKEGSSEPSVSGLITGRIAIGGADVEIEYAFPGDFVLRAALPDIDLAPLLQELVGTTALRDTAIPAAILDAKLTDGYFTVAPSRGYLQVAARTPIGDLEMMASKTKRGSWGCAIGVAVYPNWNLSEIAQGLDGLDLDSVVLVVSTESDDALSLSMINPARPQVELNRDRLGTGTPESLDSRIKRGINLFASLSLSGTGADKVLGIDQLQIFGAVGPNPESLLLEARIEGNVPLGPDAQMQEVAFQLRPAPSNFSVKLVGVVAATIGDDDLNFVGGLQINPRDAAVMATMLGDWTDPLGFDDITMSDVALDLGWSFATSLPTVGIAGSIEVGTVQASAAVRFDTGKPERAMLAASLNRIVVTDLIDSFVAQDVRKDIPAEARKMLASTGMEQVDLHIVPMPSRIGEIEYEQGIRAKGRIFAPGFSAAADLVVDPERGIKVEAAMTPIEIAGLFKVSGARGLPGPSMKVVARRGEPFIFLVQGAVELLGLQADAFIHLQEEGFEFELNGNIYDLFEAKIYAKGNTLASEAGFWLMVEMQNDLMEYLRKEATDAINKAAQSAISELSEAQRDIDAAQREVDKLDGNIRDVRAVIKREREAHQRALRSARGDVNKAQGEVNKLDSSISSMRRTIRKERARDVGRLRSARREVSKAQGTVNSLQSEIDSSKRRIKELNGHIAAKKRWVDNSPWYRKVDRGIEFSAYSVAKGAEISVLYTKIGGIEAAKGTAWGVLEAARFTVREIERAADTFPIDADVRIAGLFTARGAATGGLEVAKGVLRAIEALSKEFPIDADPRIAGLFTARETASLALAAAHGVLAGIKSGIGGLAEVGTHIVKFGLGGLLDIKRARFEATLSSSLSSRFNLQLDLSFMGRRPETLDLAFNFNNPLEGAKRLATDLIDRAA